MILNKGKKIAEESPDNLKRLWTKTEVIQLQLNSITDTLLTNIKNIEGVKDVYSTEPRIIRIHCQKIDEVLRRIIEVTKNERLEIIQISTSTPTMQDVFLKIIGEK
jgi:ABC-2 type transport system ATP-binding protein